MRPLVAALALVLPLAVSAAPAISCHCFRDRAYDPARPASADPYLLATTRNSLLSAAFGVSKPQLVAAEMTGAAPDDLWIAHWAAARTALPAAGLLDARAAKGAWAPALGDAAQRLPAPFRQRLARGAGAAELAAIAVDDVLATRLHADAAALAALNAAGATSAERILAVVAAPVLGAPAPALLARVRDGGTTWGALLDGRGVAPAQLDGIVRAAVR